MNSRAVFAILALLSVCRASRATEPSEPTPAPAVPAPAGPTTEPASDAAPAENDAPQAPVLTASNATEVAPRADLLVFKGTLLLNEFVYRAVLKLPPDAKATAQEAHEVGAQIAAFLHDAGYDLAKVRTQVVGEQIEVRIDEGALDKIIFTGAGWLPALRFRAALDLPLDVFNRRLFESQMPLLARKFGLQGYRYELWPVHLIGADNALSLEGMGELRAMPMIQPARGYELRIFAQTEKWSTGFSPEVILNGQIGVGVGGRYRWKDVAQDGDRWQAHFRVGGAMRGHLDPDLGSRPVNTNDYLTARWLSKPWGGDDHGLRMTINPRAELWLLQRKDLHLEQYRVGRLEGGVGAGAQLSRELSLYFVGGMQRRWLYGVEWQKGTAPIDDVANVPSVEYRGFVRAETAYTFNPTELRRDLKNELTAELNVYQPTRGGNGYFRFDVQATKNFAFGWHELRTLFRVGGELGNVLFVDEIPLDDHFRIGFGLEKYTQRIASTRLEFRWSLIRDKIKIGPFTDLGVWRHLPRDDANQSAELAGSSGGGVYFFVLDELQIDVFYGVGWSTDNFTRTGLNLQIHEAF